MLEEPPSRSWDHRGSLSPMGGGIVARDTAGAKRKGENSSAFPCLPISCPCLPMTKMNLKREGKMALNGAVCRKQPLEYTTNQGKAGNGS